MPEEFPAHTKWPEHLLRMIDVGGAGGLQKKWHPFADKITPILFEPNPAEAEKLGASLSRNPNAGTVVTTGLFNNKGPRDLHIARYWGCTSLRKPNTTLLSRYRIGGAFATVSIQTIECDRYDNLHARGEVPQPDVIKVDVQGCEYEVLEGFGALLNGCLGIELETHIYPIYEGQKLLHDLVTYLEQFGFVLRKLSQVPSFDGDVVECDAFFTKNISAWRLLDESRKRKLQLFCEVCDLIDYSRVTRKGDHNAIEPG